ncbi:cobyric acid synthase CobQ [Methanococcus voltae]|uniref:Probable cobyric acid synthase n=2 Tax=Methanococcus voltae TaxID=2188 RepID=A0A8J7UQV8_METVO|nr:cobyric acid synthase CobQ [Methanococcus voltae]MBP2171897.1 adenosylcobyric acid synthase [Methanococcus voltae]MBP2201148.1 adenosylcobyric acid synthase [Methanococcus voltae]MCS3921871.1 adenosylcobyric acid synthase [Methanococcus voltae PS]
MAKFIMVAGTASNSGKTVMVSGICRMLANKGYKVAPFKSQNMSLNSRVSVEDGEIAVAQYTQSVAAKVEPSTHFNPVLLKPKGNFTSQVIIHGKPYKNLDYNEYRNEKDYCIEKIKESLDYLNKNYDYVIMEGAGSCCEINLLEDDIANLRVAEMANADVLLVSDIDRGGVFASLYGTVELLPENWRKLIKGFIINKFRGNADVLTDGFKKITELTNIDVAGLIPYDESLILPEEDSQAIQSKKVFGNMSSPIEVNVVKFSKIANFTDVDALSTDARIKFVDFNEDITGDMLILPGTRCSTLEMDKLKNSGMDKKIKEYIDNGGIVLGICGGYQMMGSKIIDEDKIESEIGTIEGLGLFDICTEFKKENKKVIKNSKGILYLNAPEKNKESDKQSNDNTSKFEVTGYELHEGITHVNEFSSLKECELIRLSEGFGNNGKGFDGMIKSDGKSLVIGTYLHGILENKEFKEYLLNLIIKRNNYSYELSKKSANEIFDENLDKLAKIIENSINYDFEGNNDKIMIK